MTTGVAITHAFVSLKGDGTDNTQVQPSNWNAPHSFQMDSGYILGRTAAGYGAVQEIAISAYMAGLLSTPDAATLAGLLGLFQTGDLKFTFQNGATSGWVQLASATDTIGNAASGANLRANADTLALFTLLWNNCSNSIAPVSTGRGASAVADFNANKTITIPAVIGRAVIGAGASTPSWLNFTPTFGLTGGEQNHLLVTAEIPSHYHTTAMYDPSHLHSQGNLFNGGAGAGGVGGGGGFGYVTSGATGYSYAGVYLTSPNGNNTTYSTGGGTAHNVMQPYIALNVWIKL